MARKKISAIDDLTPDPLNANRGTERGAALLEDSLRRYGAGRSILADRNGVVIAGNKTLEKAAELGIPIRTIPTKGTELVVVVREDLDLINDPADKARALAYFDNRVGELDLSWDTEQILADLDVVPELEDLFPLDSGYEEDDEGTPTPKASGAAARKILQSLIPDLEAIAEEGILPTGEYVADSVREWAAGWISTIHATGEV